MRKVGQSVQPTPESQTLAGLAEIVTDLSRRMMTVERHLVKRRPDANARCMTRPDKTPYGWKPHPKNPALLIEDRLEQQTIFKLIEFAAQGASYRELARRLDLAGYKRRGGKQWASAHGLVRSILRRQGILTPADAVAAVHRQIQQVKRRAMDQLIPKSVSDDQARSWLRGDPR